MKQTFSSIISKSEVIPGSYLIWLEAPQIATQAKPGQFVMVHCGKDTVLRRPVSIHQLNDTKLAMLFAVVGKGTHWLSQRQVGEKIDLLGPLGNGFSVNSDSHNLLLVAGGIGIAPLCFLAQEATSQERSVTLLLGASTASQLYPSNLLPAEVKLVTATEDGTAGKKGMVTDFLPDLTNGADQVFACGPVPMYQTIAKQSSQLLERKLVQVSLEARMGCGVSICYGCTVRTKNGLKQVCKDGPVFNLKDIIWDELAPR